MPRQVIVKGKDKRGRPRTIECSVSDTYTKAELCVWVYKQIKPDLSEVRKVSVAKSERHAALKLHGDIFKSIVRAQREAQAWKKAQIIDLAREEPDSDVDDWEWLKEKMKVTANEQQSAAKTNVAERRPVVIHQDRRESEPNDIYPSWVELPPEPSVEKARTAQRKVRSRAPKKPEAVFDVEQRPLQDPTEWCPELPGSFPEEKPTRRPAYPGHRPYQGNA